MRYHRLLSPAALPLLVLPSLGYPASLTVLPGETLGAVVQTQQIDTFTMTGGTLQSLNQGQGFDDLQLLAGQGGCPPVGARPMAVSR
ncbi:hypothetical protein D3C81_804740 [compost metagenome]|jgi:hypothetical protein